MEIIHLLVSTDVLLSRTVVLCLVIRTDVLLTPGLPILIIQELKRSAQNLGMNTRIVEFSDTVCCKLVILQLVVQRSKQSLDSLTIFIGNLIPSTSVPVLCIVLEEVLSERSQVLQCIPKLE